MLICKFIFKQWLLNVFVSLFLFCSTWGMIIDNFNEPSSLIFSNNGISMNTFSNGEGIIEETRELVISYQGIENATLQVIDDKCTLIVLGNETCEAKVIWAGNPESQGLSGIDLTEQNSKQGFEVIFQIENENPSLEILLLVYSNNNENVWSLINIPIDDDNDEISTIVLFDDEPEACGDEGCANFNQTDAIELILSVTANVHISILNVETVSVDPSPSPAPTPTPTPILPPPPTGGPPYPEDDDDDDDDNGDNDSGNKDSSSKSNNDSTVALVASTTTGVFLLLVLLLVIAVVIGVSIFWWRRRKNREIKTFWWERQ